MHAALCIPTITGAWLHEGGGAFHNNADIYHWNKSVLEGHDMRDKSVRMLDQSRIGAILTGDKASLCNGPPVTAMLIQNTNPVSVCPDQDVVKRGFARDDLFVCVHEQFMTETARMADLVLPATMFMEHDDVYQGGGHQHIILGAKAIEPPGECRSNHEVICALAKRLGAKHPGFDMTARQMIDWTLQKSGWGTLAELEAKKWIDCQPDFETAHYIKGFNWPDGKFRFKPDWPNVPFRSPVPGGPVEQMPNLPDYWTIIEVADEEHPFRLATSPSRGLPQFDVQRDAELTGARSAADCDDPSGRCGAARHRRPRGSDRRQHAGQGAPACQGVRRRAPGRADCGIDLAERRLSGWARHQHHHRCGSDRAVRRRRVP